ncbi:RluA family pseudouridine synthase [Patescibacteria group bacterium]
MIEDKLIFNLIVFGEEEGMRLDKFLAVWGDKQGEFECEFSRGDWIKLIKKGKVTVNNLIEKPSYRLSEGDDVYVEVKEVNTKELVAQKKINIDVVFEGTDFIVINKQANISVHPDNRHNKNTLVNGLIARYPEIISVSDTDEWSYLRPGIVHRLDKDTTGLMIVARNQRAFNELKSKFKDRKITKKYQAITYGKVFPKEGIIDKPLARSTNYKKQVIAGQKTKTKVRDSITEYSVIKEFEKYSLVEVSPKTGRMHQIRVHLFSLGNPIVGDRLYKKREFMNDNFIKADRQMLHAVSLDFSLFGKKHSFTAELPNDFKKTLNRLGA